jgi:hypothetical protein
MAMNRLKEMATSVSQTFAHINVFQRGGSSGSKQQASAETKDNMMALIGELKNTYRSEPAIEGAAFQITEPRNVVSISNPEIFAHDLDANTPILDLGQEEQVVIDYEDILEF